IADYAAVCKAVADSDFCVAEVLSGLADGVDTLAVRYAEEHRLPEPHGSSERPERPSQGVAESRTSRPAGAGQRQGGRPRAAAAGVRPVLAGPQLRGEGRAGSDSASPWWSPSSRCTGAASRPGASARARAPSSAGA